MKIPVSLLFGCVVSLAAALFFQHRAFDRRATASAAAMAKLGADVDELNAALARAAPRVEVVHERRVVEPAPTPTPAAADPSEAPTDEGASGAAAPADAMNAEAWAKARAARIAKARAQELTRFQQRFDGEPRDARWAEREERDFAQAMQSGPARPRAITALECRSQTCRIEASFDSLVLGNLFIDTMFAGPDALMRHQGVTIPAAEEASDGTYHSTIFVAQPGDAQGG